MQSIEQVIRDILDAAVADGLVIFPEHHGTSQHMSSGDLVGPANVLEQYIEQRLAAKDAEIANAWRSGVEMHRSALADVGNLLKDRDRLTAEVEELRKRLLAVEKVAPGVFIAECGSADGEW